MYEELKNLIAKNNQKYSQLNDVVHSLEHNCCNIETSKLEEARFAKWQFIHDYAAELSDFLWKHKEALSADDLTALDSVLYNVWQKMSEKSNIVVQTIMKIYKGEKFD